MYPKSAVTVLCIGTRVIGLTHLFHAVRGTGGCALHLATLHIFCSCVRLSEAVLLASCRSLTRIAYCAPSGSFVRMCIPHRSQSACIGDLSVLTQCPPTSPRGGGSGPTTWARDNLFPPKASTPLHVSLIPQGIRTPQLSFGSVGCSGVGGSYAIPPGPHCCSSQAVARRRACCGRPEGKQ